jgi:hypothetical protein
MKLFPHIRLAQPDHCQCQCQQALRGLVASCEEAKVEICIEDGYSEGEYDLNIFMNGLYIGTVPEDRAKDIIPLVKRGKELGANIFEIKRDESDPATLVPYINVFTRDSGPITDGENKNGALLPHEKSGAAESWEVPDAPW